MEPTETPETTATTPTSDGAEKMENEKTGCCSKQQKEDAVSCSKPKDSCCSVTMKTCCTEKQESIEDKTSSMTACLQSPRKCVDLCRQGCCVTVLCDGARKKICLSTICSMNDAGKKKCCVSCCKSPGIRRGCCKGLNMTVVTCSSDATHCGDRKSCYNKTEYTAVVAGLSASECCEPCDPESAGISGERPIDSKASSDIKEGYIKSNYKDSNETYSGVGCNSDEFCFSLRDNPEGGNEEVLEECAKSCCEVIKNRCCDVRISRRKCSASVNKCKKEGCTNECCKESVEDMVNAKKSENLMNEEDKNSCCSNLDEPDRCFTVSNCCEVPDQCNIGTQDSNNCKCKKPCYHGTCPSKGEKQEDGAIESNENFCQCTSIQVREKENDSNCFGKTSKNKDCCYGGIRVTIMTCGCCDGGFKRCSNHKSTCGNAKGSEKVSLLHTKICSYQQDICKKCDCNCVEKCPCNKEDRDCCCSNPDESWRYSTASKCCATADQSNTGTQDSNNCKCKKSCCHGTCQNKEEKQKNCTVESKENFCHCISIHGREEVNDSNCCSKTSKNEDCCNFDNRVTIMISGCSDGCFKRCSNNKTTGCNIKGSEKDLRQPTKICYCKLDASKNCDRYCIKKCPCNKEDRDSCCSNQDESWRDSAASKCCDTADPSNIGTQDSNNCKCKKSCCHGTCPNKGKKQEDCTIESNENVCHCTGVQGREEENDTNCCCKTSKNKDCCNRGKKVTIIIGGCWNVGFKQCADNKSTCCGAEDSKKDLQQPTKIYCEQDPSKNCDCNCDTNGPFGCNCSNSKNNSKVSCVGCIKRSCCSSNNIDCNVNFRKIQDSLNESASQVEVEDSEYNDKSLDKKRCSIIENCCRYSNNCNGSCSDHCGCTLGGDDGISKENCCTTINNCACSGKNHSVSEVSCCCICKQECCDAIKPAESVRRIEMGCHCETSALHNCACYCYKTNYINTYCCGVSLIFGCYNISIECSCNCCTGEKTCCPCQGNESYCFNAENEFADSCCYRRDKLRERCNTVKMGESGSQIKMNCLCQTARNEKSECHCFKTYSNTHCCNVSLTIGCCTATNKCWNRCIGKKICSKDGDKIDDPCCFQGDKRECCNPSRVSGCCKA